MITVGSRWALSWPRFAHLLDAEVIAKVITEYDERAPGGFIPPYVHAPRADEG